MARSSKKQRPSPFTNKVVKANTHNTTAPHTNNTQDIDMTNNNQTNNNHDAQPEPTPTDTSPAQTSNTTLVLICPDANYTSTQLRHLLNSSKITYYTVNTIDNSAYVEFLTVNDINKASTHPSLAGFTTANVDSQKLFQIKLTNLPPKITSLSLTSLLFADNPVGLEIHSSNKNKQAQRPSAVATFKSRADYELNLALKFINYGDFTIFLHDHCNGKPNTHRLILSGLPSTATEPALGKVLLQAGVAASTWHIPFNHPTQSSIAAFIAFDSEQAAKHASETRLMINGHHLHWITESATCLDCYSSKSAHLPFCPSLKTKQHKKLPNKH